MGGMAVEDSELPASRQAAMNFAVVLTDVAGQVECWEVAVER